MTGVLIGHRFDQVAQKRIIKLLALLRTDSVTLNKGKSVILGEINCSLVRLNGDLPFVSQSWRVTHYARIECRQLLSHHLSVTRTFLHALSVFQTAVFQRNEIRLRKTWCRQRPLINISCPVAKIADILTVSNCIPSFHFPSIRSLLSLRACVALTKIHVATCDEHHRAGSCMKQHVPYKNRKEIRPRKEQKR